MPFFSENSKTLALAPAGVSLAEVKLQKTRACEKPKTVKVDSQFSDPAQFSHSDSGDIFGPVNEGFRSFCDFSKTQNNAPNLGPPQKTQGLEDLGVFEDVQFCPQTTHMVYPVDRIISESFPNLAM